MSKKTLKKYLHHIEDRYFIEFDEKENSTHLLKCIDLISNKTKKEFNSLNDFYKFIYKIIGKTSFRYHKDKIYLDNFRFKDTQTIYSLYLKEFCEIRDYIKPEVYSYVAYKISEYYRSLSFNYTIEMIESWLLDDDLYDGYPYELFLLKDIIHSFEKFCPSVFNFENKNYNFFEKLLVSSIDNIYNFNFCIVEDLLEECLEEGSMYDMDLVNFIEYYIIPGFVVSYSDSDVFIESIVSYYNDSLSGSDSYYEYQLASQIVVNEKKINILNKNSIYSFENFKKSFIDFNDTTKKLKEIHEN